MPGTQLKQLAQKTDRRFVKQVDKGFGNIDYVPHYQTIQMLLRYLDRPFNWTVSEPYDSGDEREPIGITGSLMLEIDNHVVEVDGVGQGRDAKNAESDAIKRAAMKVGLGLDLWAQDGYWLDRAEGWGPDDTVPHDGTEGHDERPFE